MLKSQTWPIFPDNGSDRQASQPHLRSHCQDAEYYSSPPNSVLPHRLVTPSTARQIMEASFRSSIQAMTGPNSRRQSLPTCRCVARCCQTRSFWSDATVQADYTRWWRRRVFPVRKKSTETAKCPHLLVSSFPNESPHIRRITVYKLAEVSVPQFTSLMAVLRNTAAGAR